MCRGGRSWGAATPAGVTADASTTSISGVLPAVPQTPWPARRRRGQVWDFTREGIEGLLVTRGIPGERADWCKRSRASAV